MADIPGETDFQLLINAVISIGRRNTSSTVCLQAYQTLESPMSVESRKSTTLFRSYRVQPERSVVLRKHCPIN
jgi:hypothetical protein